VQRDTLFNQSRHGVDQRVNIFADIHAADEKHHNAALRYAVVDLRAHAVAAMWGEHGFVDAEPQMPHAVRADERVGHFMILGTGHQREAAGLHMMFQLALHALLLTFGEFPIVQQLVTQAWPFGKQSLDGLTRENARVRRRIGMERCHERNVFGAADVFRRAGEGKKSVGCVDDVILR